MENAAYILIIMIHVEKVIPMPPSAFPPSPSPSLSLFLNGIFRKMFRLMDVNF